ncbi:uncharacterized protein LOC116196582 [Punica granatum]|uniref:Uncharacterized protein n=2 Tax=Punica granatum TaxID=22663 RepID=A0A2I0KDB6_PUNGR|nr:uncharacterized protein LOC116196582 [Punica granatum]PKI66512.1 hypothetical protein CRG98_013076 [Punica granatum]
MEESMRDCLRKLALWHTRTFRPITTHDELDLIMSTLGFVGLPPSSPSALSSTAWKEYAYSAQWRRRRHSGHHHHHAPPSPPRPRLPYPRIDGLHSYTYQAFIDAVNFYLEMPDISLLFHIRGMPLQRVEMYKKWRRMQEDESVFVYREGTLDQSTYHLYHRVDGSKQQHHGSSTPGSGSLILRRDKGAANSTAPPPDCVVPLKDIIVV